MKRLVFAAAALLLGAVPVGHKPAQATVGQWNLVTDEVNANFSTGAFSSPHHVLLTRADGSTINADRATGNYKQKRATLYGHVVMNDSSGTFGLKSAQNAEHAPAALTTDELQVNDVTHLYDAIGNVHYTQSATLVDAQNAHLNDLTHQLDLSGNVHIVQADRTLDAKSATYNTLSGDGEADGNVSIVFPGITPSFATPKPIVIKKPKIPGRTLRYDLLDGAH